MHLPLAPDGRTASERAHALEQARDSPDAAARLEGILLALDRALRAARAGEGPQMFEELDTAYTRLGEYLAHLQQEASLRVSCQAGCSACCTDIPPTLPVEGLRAARALLRLSDGPTRVQRAVEYARRFQRMLLARTQNPSQVDIASEAYRRTQLEFRALGLPCPALDDDGRCGIYDERPLACRVFVHVQDPARCETSHPQFLENERPPLWSHPRQAEVERKLLAISRALGLPATPNFSWAVARLHDHPLARATD